MYNFDKICNNYFCSLSKQSIKHLDVFTFAWTDGLTRRNASSKWDLLPITGCPPLERLFITVRKAQMDASLTKAAKSAPLLKNKIINIAGNYWLHAQNILAHLV